MNPKPFKSPIYVAKPFLPPIEEFQEGLKEIWNNAWLTNNGPVVQRYREALCRHFDTDNLCLFNNGTLALQIALQGMQISGEVITTPFTFVATTHALFWNKCRPVFVDIEPHHYTLDPAQVEAAITPWTSAILAVHVYGHPCQYDALAAIARKHNLRLIYDAAHAFDVQVGGVPIGKFGDLSMFSFHSTKLYHSIEGGMLVFADAGLLKTFDYLKNFGFENEEEVVMPGTNAKMNEFQALMGLQVLRHLPHLIERRRAIAECYRDQLADVPGVYFPARLPRNVTYNYAYFPVEIEESEFGLSRDELYAKLKEFNVHTRRYFYPLLCDLACYRSVPLSFPIPVARRVARRILTLPIFDSLAIDDVERICDILKALCPALVRRSQSSRASGSERINLGKPVVNGIYVAD
ncbi:MAG: DegT/DnrJ/EryC1/StrS family aminotransferase [Verrucomicrobiae bacterium]|nr:DegT/DnrJ/EryC1/StrS family aminotransferase [Verrucomicrobiae bacterium]